MLADRHYSKAYQIPFLVLKIEELEGYIETLVERLRSEAFWNLFLVLKMKELEEEIQNACWMAPFPYGRVVRNEGHTPVPLSFQSVFLKAKAVPGRRG